MPDGLSQSTSYCNKKFRVKQYHKCYQIIHGRDDEAPNCKPKQKLSLLLKSSFPILWKLHFLKIVPLQGSSCNTRAYFLLFKQYKRKSPQERKKRKRSSECQDYYRIPQPALKRVIIFSGSSLSKGLIQQSPQLFRYQPSSNTFEFPVIAKETPQSFLSWNTWPWSFQLPAKRSARQRSRAAHTHSEHDAGTELSQRARFPRSPPHQQPREQLQKRREIQVRKAGCGKQRGPADRQGPSSISPCLPDPAPVTTAGRGTPGGTAPHRNRPSLPYTRQGRSARGGSPGAPPALPPACRAAQGSPDLSPPPPHRPRSSAPAAAALPSPARHGRPIGCRSRAAGGSANQRRQDAPAGRFGNFRYFQKALGGGGGPGSARPSATGPVPPPRPPKRGATTTRPRLRALCMLTLSPGTREPR